MANLKEVKNRITSVKSTQQITKAMKMVAASKLRRAQDRIERVRPYTEKLTSILENVSSGSDHSSIEFAVEREVNKVLLVVVTSDRGLCGAFNMNAIKKTLSVIDEKYKRAYEAGFLTIMPIGRKAQQYFARRGYNLIEDYVDSFQDLSFDNVRPAAEHAMNGFLNGKFDQVELIYNEFRNVAVQILRDEQFLPIQQSESEESNSENFESDFIYEPSKEFIIEELIPKSLKMQFYKALLESNASEHGARMTAMDKATDNAGELLKSLRLTYNRTRQAAITTEILEIVAGAEALSKKS
ncbi:ATP synthase F1 subunit gamma [Aureibacter tunicatorum]|uniref:ATP synthase gamma chain n=1 Tax=Aureibacter tunicatorum TaxID=866807 RepID=A0AAE4BQ51_9BACT|nr:ATP synthase F1 subunit gamma [Aureibacter tunicatorum]MDR6237191.1 F-type H+-transporting ATPase subunit gamma [Aureibacter tunicatorum]BDD06183.1 ATP synthase gamma chain [Aureibacter tunicatorum]